MPNNTTKFEKVDEHGRIKLSPPKHGGIIREICMIHFKMKSDFFIAYWVYSSETACGSHEVFFPPLGGHRRAQRHMYMAVSHFREVERGNHMFQLRSRRTSSSQILYIISKRRAAHMSELR
jgi:hypothetical protein